MGFRRKKIVGNSVVLSSISGVSLRSIRNVQNIFSMDFGKGWLVVLVAVILAVGCGPSQEEMASSRLRVARAYLEQSDTTTALIQIDSILMLHPKAAVSCNAASNLRREIHWDIYLRKQLAIDSVKIRIARLESSFILTKGEFERTSRYVHRRQIPEENLSRSFLRADVTPTGDLILTSQFYGSGRISHRQVRVYDGKLEAFTDTVATGSADIYHGNFLGTTWERVTFRGGREMEVAPFISANSRLKLKMAFLGKGNSYAIVMEERDKQAVRESVDLAMAIRELKTLEQEVAVLMIR